ncbi:hypothetical protein FFL01_03730 [Flavobacterium flevense]|uniref:Uncharacterized protein n=1 Tax=Flavobacterium flevense TaxID=983 RepID=A0A4Y4AWA3_9FLAO|nr:hypothetical protein FFL01_03730 [Flavobacterium flevense]
MVKKLLICLVYYFCISEKSVPDVLKHTILDLINTAIAFLTAGFRRVNVYIFVGFIYCVSF